LFSIPNAASAQVPVEPAQPSPQAIDAAEIDRSISTVIRRREFTWRERIPNKSDQARPPAWLTRLTEAVSSGWEWFKKKLRDWFRTERPNESGGKDAPVTPRLLQWMIGIAVVLVAGLLVAFFRRRQKKIVTAQAIAAAPAAVDLTDESVGADQLPESSWLALAQDWINQGDFRLALRALYLAGLSFLGQRRLISLRRWKCGLDYRRELERRTRAQPELAPLFARNVALFEQGWYGRHAVDRGTVEAFAAGLDQLRKHAG
jgi:hypothetical protein